MRKAAVTEGRCWVREYEGWQRSGVRQSAYCEVRGYSLAQFKYGVQGAKKEGRISDTGAKDLGTEKVSRFVAIKAGAAGGAVSSKKAAYCEIWFNGEKGLSIETSGILGELRHLAKGLFC